MREGVYRVKNFGKEYLRPRLQKTKAMFWYLILKGIADLRAQRE